MKGLMQDTPRQLFHTVFREVGSLVPSDQISLALPSPDGERFVVCSVYPETSEAPGWEVPRDGSCAALVLKRRRTELFPSLGAEFHFPEEEALHREGMRAAAFVPLFLAGEPYGVLILAVREPRSLEGKGLRFLERIGGLLALAVAATSQEPSAPPSGPLRQAFGQMAVFSRVSNRIVQEDHLEAACRLFLETIREHSGYRRAVLTLLDAEGKDSQSFFTGFSDDDIDAFHRHKLTPTQRRAIFHDRHRHGNSYLVPAEAATELVGLRPGGAGASAAGSAGLLFIPLYGGRGSMIGTVMLDEPAEDNPPSAEALSALELFASGVAHAIEKKRLDVAVKNAQARLRTVQEQLMQAEKMSAIGQLISGVTHELNNPLSGIMGFAQLLLGAEVNPKTKKNLERIYTEAVRCQKIVHNLLSFSRRHQPEKTSRRLDEVIESVLELRAYQLQVDDVAVERRYDPSLPPTMVDVHQIQQVVLNVVNNAHQAMMLVADRPRRLTIATERKGDRLCVRISDTGSGIPRERLEKIFDPFYTTKAEGKGTGLGLSVSRAIIREHQGTISAGSVLGEGTTMTLDLPLVADTAAPRADEEKPASARAPVPLRLLVVDDEEVLTELLGDFLRSVGHQVDQARDGRQALSMASSRDYDIILSDLKMPGLDGQGFYEQLNMVKPWMAGRFVFSTGDLANPKVQTFFQVSGCPYLSKPFKLESVLKVIDQVVRKLRAA